jgi:uncharacterized protein (DUF433 family)
MNNWQEQILIDPLVCHGKPCIKGTLVLWFQLYWIT